jgi:hypothetical protein
MRKVGDSAYELARAIIALAGLRVVKQATISPGASAAASYTVTEANTRRVLAIHNSAAAFDIRVNPLGTATNSHFPVLPQFYFGVDAGEGDVISYYNASAGSVTVYILELE